jgi:hypothetical protein
VHDADRHDRPATEDDDAESPHERSEADEAMTDAFRGFA